MGWNERRVRMAKRATEQHARRPNRAAERAAAERSAAERAWLARERAQGRDEKAAYARWEERRRAWLRREARKAVRKRKTPRGCNVLVQGAAVAEELTASAQEKTVPEVQPAAEAEEQQPMNTIDGGGSSAGELAAEMPTDIIAGGLVDQTREEHVRSAVQSALGAEC